MHTLQIMRLIQRIAKMVFERQINYEISTLNLIAKNDKIRSTIRNGMQSWGTPIIFTSILLLSWENTLKILIYIDEQYTHKHTYTQTHTHKQSLTKRKKTLKNYSYLQSVHNSINRYKMIKFTFSIFTQRRTIVVWLRGFCYFSFTKCRASLWFL